jgi:hypothetical protein
MQVPVPEFNGKINRYQLEILRKFDRKEFRFALLNWHRRARKTTLLLNVLIKECCKNPNKIYGYVAPTYTQAKGIVWNDPNMLNKYLPHEYVKRKNDSELLVEFVNGSLLVIRGGDNPDSIRGQDYEGIAGDEFALWKREVWEEILRPIITPNPDRWAIFAFTPKGLNHAYDYWIKSDKWDGWHKSLLRASDSGIIDLIELQKARNEMPETLYMQEFECEFLAGDEFALIKPVELEALKGITFVRDINRRIISCDPATGGDECVVQVIENSKVLEQMILHYNDTMKIVGELMVLSHKYSANDFAIDSIGIGQGIADRLSEMGKRVNAINSAEKADDPERFYNRRAEMWWYVMGQIQSRELSYPHDDVLRRQLCSVRYKVVNSNGQIKLEPKEETKKRLGASPDRADAFVYGVWGLKDVLGQGYPSVGYNFDNIAGGGRGGW